MRIHLKRQSREWLLFEGRISRTGFLLRTLACLLLLVLPVVIPSNISTLGLSFPLALVAWCLFVWVFFGLQVRRLHDVSMHGLWILLPWAIAALGIWFEFTRARPSHGVSWAWAMYAVPLWLLFLLLAPGKRESKSHGTQSSTI